MDYIIIFIYQFQQFDILQFLMFKSLLFYSISLSQEQDRKDRDYSTSSFLDFHNAQEIELNRLEVEKNNLF